MLNRFLLALALLCMPIALVGCESSEPVVGTGDKQPPPEVAAEIAKRDAAYAEQMKKMQENPTPAPAEAAPANP